LKIHSTIIKVPVFLILIFGLALKAQCQISESIPLEEHNDTAYTVVDSMPSFPGGENELFRWLGQNIKTPKIDAQGVVYAHFIVEKDGSISNVEIIKGIHDAYDKEVLRVVGLMPNWEPGYKAGKIVRVQYNIPIRFSN